MTPTPDDEAGFEQQPPNDLDAEQAVLGAMLTDTKVIDRVLVTVDAGDFYRPAHQTIYLTIRDTYSRSREPRIDPITISSELDRVGDLTRVGGTPYLHTLVNSVPTAANAEYYAEIVHNLAAYRAVIESGMRAVQRAYAAQEDVAGIVDVLMGDLQAALGGRTATDAPLSVGDRWEGFLEELQTGTDPRALDTPWPDLNDVVQFKPGQLITVGAATGGGKSLFGLNVAGYVALTLGRPVLVASMEMGGSELMARLTAAEASVELTHLVRRQVTDSDWQKIIGASDRLQNAHNFILDDSPNLTLSKIRSRVRWMAARGHTPAMIVADYLQLLTPEGSTAATNRASEVAALSRGLKLLAMEFEIPVVALAQFNRGATGRQPLVTDFKDSSAIEQDSNVIILMHRPLADDGSDTTARAGEVDLIIAKNRNGATGRIIPLSFQGHMARLRSMARGF